MAEPVRITVAICTYDRYDLLARTVEALLARDRIDGAVAELVVVDNTPPALRRPVSLPDGPGRRVVHCDDVGLSHARNFAIDHSESEIVAFLDDDALVCTNWTRHILDVFDRQPEALIVGGRVVPFFDDPSAIPEWYDPKLASHLSCIDWSPVGRFLASGEWVVGANLSFRRVVFDSYGRFDPALGRRGVASLLSNEEIALLEKVGKSRIFYAPEACVEHIIAADRLTPEHFRRRVFWQAVSDIVSGSCWMTTEHALQRYRDTMVRSPPQYRNIKAVSYEPRTSTEFLNQLDAIYAMTMVAGAGFKGEEY